MYEGNYISGGLRAYEAGWLLHESLGKVRGMLRRGELQHAPGLGTVHRSGERSALPGLVGETSRDSSGCTASRRTSLRSYLA